MEIGSKRKSPRALTQISGAISDAKAEYKCKRKDLAAALKAENKSDHQEQLISENPRLSKTLKRQWATQKNNQSRLAEMYDSAEELAPKVAKLIEMIREADHPIVYTGAGISTSANIPDYRGTGGVYSAMAAGQDIKRCNLVTATPTLGHMALSGLIKNKIFKFLLSQNCDGLHLRSGVPPEQLSEIHGNMFMENCDEGHFFYRAFDVTEKTNVKRHKTGRACPIEDCDEELYDAIVHFGEMNRFDIPYRWEAAETHSSKTDLIICIGTSLKVLKAYKVLWPKKCKLVIINLQWTPKDKKADLLIRGQSDQILCEVAKAFDVAIPSYSESDDPLIALATALNENDHKPSTPFLNMVENNPKFQGLSMSEENSPFRENGNEPLGRSSTIHLPMADSPDAPEGKLSARSSEKLLEINDDLACGDASAEILTNSISLDDDESNKSTEEAKVPAFEAPKMLPFLKYSFSEDFPYSNGPDDVEYKKFRQKFIFPTSATNGTEKWIEDKELQYMLHVELQNLAKQDKKGYIFHVNAWASLREENKIENHMKRPFSRFGEPVKKIIWLANRGKKAHATRRQMQQEKLDLFKYDVLFMPVNQDSHWSLIVVNKPREIFEKLLSGDFEEEEEQRNAEEETREQDSISELVLPGMDDTTENDQLPSSEDESEKEHLDQEQNMSVSNSKEGQLDSSSDEEMNVEEARGERDDSADPSESAEKKHEPDALEKSQPAEETSMISQSEIQLSELSLGAAPEEQREEQDLAEEDHETMETDAPESEEEGDRALPYDRSDGEDEDDESEEEYSEDGGPTLRDLAEDREKVYQCPAEDEPAIYLLCSAYTQDWHEKCELMNEFLTSAFLDRTNESLRDLHEKLLEAGIIAEKSDKYYEIVAGGREPADYFCTKLHLQRQLSHLPSYQIPWPCQKCDNMEPCFHNQLLPFKYGMPYGPHQCNDFDCGNFAVYFIRRWFDSDRPDMSADAPTLKKWFTLRDIFDYKYECRRFLDKLVGWEDREPANEQGKAERYGYTDDYEEALTKWKALTDNEKQKRVEAPQAEEKVETKEEAEVTNDAAKEAETESELVPEQVKENGVHDEDPIIDNEKPAETADESEVQAQEKNVDDAQDTPPEVSPHHPQVETPVAKDEPEKIETPKEEPIVDDNVSVDTASSTVSTHNLRRRSSTPLYAPARARNTASPRNGSFDLDAVKVSPLVGESDQSPVRRKTPQEQSVENDKLVALKIYQNILNPRPKREAKTRADSILSPARVPRARRSMPTKAPKALPMKRKNEKEVGTSATKRRKTTSIPVSPKPKQSPKKVTRRRKTVSLVPEDPVIKPIDAVKFFESRARFVFASTLFKDEDFPRTLRFARPNEAIMLTKPDKVKVKARKNSRRSSRIGTK